jgi:DNA repair exonuclease SbcCD nuclease subunit
MRLLASGDNHFAEHLRFQECIDVHAWMVHQAREVKADVFLDAGDIFDAASSPRERQAVAEWVTAMAEVCPVVFAKGNHDRPLDVALMRRLKTKHPVIVEEACGVHHVAGAAIAVMAWPERAHLLAALGDAAAADTGMREALQGALRGLGLQLEQHNGPRILLGHFMVDGSVSSTGQPLLGMPINVSLSDLAIARADLTVMGHIHMAQRFELPGAGPAFYTGSPFRTDFGQLERKSVLFAEFDGQRLLRTEELETPCTAMLHVESAWDADRRALVFAGDPPRFEQPGEIRLRYQVAAELRDAARVAADELRSLYLTLGAKSVKVEEVVIAERRARAPEVAKATSVQDKLDAHWLSLGYDPGEQRGELHVMAAELEQEVANAS